MAGTLETAAKNSDTDFISMHHEELIGILRITVSGILVATGIYK